MKKIYVGLSGGVDSSVAAALLQRDGYDVTGVYMKNWTQDLPGADCPWRQDLNDARAVAAHLDIPFKVFDFEAEYRERVVSYMVGEYQAGRTPNPDIMCNQEIKFKLFLEAALADGAAAIATGHYARVEDGQLLRSADDNKDQTYFLYRVERSALQRTHFPLANLSKPQVRQLAAELSLPTAAKKDSQGICFVGPVGMRAFLRQYMTATPGPIIAKDGRMIGQHEGAVFYTIGQRSGLGVGGGKPFYVVSKDMEVNTVHVTDNPADLELASDRLQLEDVHWIGDQPAANQQLTVRLRHRGELVDAQLTSTNELILSRPMRALAVGQSAVLYDDQTCVGGGVIAAAIMAVV
jgi:tRNA-specific 2-thiouridylase